MSDTKLSVTSVTINHQYGEVVGDEITDNGTGSTNLRVYVTREMAAKAILAEDEGRNKVFALIDSRGMIYEVWGE